MKHLTFLLLSCSMVLPAALPAQQPAAGSSAHSLWTLRQCIDYATTHNINICQQALQEENNRIALQTTRASRLPGLSAGLSEGFGFGRSTGRDGATVDRTSANTSFSISTSMPLFTGFRIPNQIKVDEFDLKAATATLAKAKQDLGITISTSYLQTLYYKGLVNIAERQVVLSREQVAVAQALVEAGKKSASELADAEAQLASAEYTLTQSQGNAALARLDLSQLLNLESVVGFDVAEPDTTDLVTGDMPRPSLVFDQAVSNHPSILAAQYQLESSKYALKVTQSGYWPTLSLSASYSNSYYHTFNEDNTSFSDQLNLNGSEYIGLSLNIPIFNRFATRNSVRQSRLSIESRTLALDDARRTLLKEIQQAYYNAATARDNYTSATKAVASNATAYHYESERYAAGKSASYDLNSARTKYEKAQQDALQAKYEYLMRMKILEYYNGVPIE